jgi:hypothetical protein
LTVRLMPVDFPYGDRKTKCCIDWRNMYCFTFACIPVWFVNLPANRTFYCGVNPRMYVHLLFRLSVAMYSRICNFEINPVLSLIISAVLFTCDGRLMPVDFP